jgi:hypothetical protein
MKLKTYKAPANASLALTFASVGDAFLYAFLPVNAALVGVSVAWIGVLLSINRFVRIFSNAWMVHLFARHGLRLITILAVVLAIISTAGYALATTVFVWLICRIAWGLSFSAMRISTLGYALQHQGQGFALGFTRGIQETGPMVVLFLVPVFINYFNTTTTFLTLGCLSLPALYFAWRLPVDENPIPLTPLTTFLKIPTVLNLITFASAFLIDGILIVVLGVLFLHYKESITIVTATTLAAVYLGYRRLCLVLFSPAGGWFADRLGLGLVFNLSLVAMIMGLIGVIIGWVEVGAVVLFTFYSIHSAITPGKISENQPHPLFAVAENATWRDVGAAAGTLAGGLLLTSDQLVPSLIFATVMLSLLLFIHIRMVTISKLMYLWK